MFEIDDEVVHVVRQWVQKAEIDLKTAAHTLKLGSAGPTDTVCFLTRRNASKSISKRCWCCTASNSSVCIRLAR